MGPQANPLLQLRAELIKLGFEKLDVDQLMQQVLAGPGYYEATQQLQKRKTQVEVDYKAIQQQIKQHQNGAQPSLF